MNETQQDLFAPTDEITAAFEKLRDLYQKACESPE